MPGGIRGPFQFQLTSLRSCRSVRSRCAFLRITDLEESHYCGSRLPSHSAGLGSRRTQFKVQSNTRLLNVRVASQLGPAIANLRIGEAKPLGMATKQHLIHPNPDRHAPSLAAVHRSCSGCSARSSCVATRTTACRLADLLCANELGPRALGCTFQPPN